MNLLCLLLSVAAPADDSVYLFSSFRGNGEDGLHLAWSEDGLKWTALGGDKSYLKPTAGRDKLMRDPCVLLGPDGVFRMTWTTGWQDKTVGYASSRDLITWSEQKSIPVMAHEPTVRNVWAPELFYDAATSEYVILWASTIPGRYPATEKAGDDGYNHRMYCTTTKDFETFTPTRLLYDGGFNVIDATLLTTGGKYYMILKDETLNPPAKNLRIAVADKAVGPYGPAGAPFTEGWVEGPSVIRDGDWWVVYYDCYTRHKYGARRSRDLVNWEDISDQLSFPRDTRHGTVLRVPRRVVEALVAAK